MRWPRPDRRAATLPTADARTVHLPGIDARTVAFPPRPDVVLLRTATAAGVGVALAEVRIVPWRTGAGVGAGVAQAVLETAVALEAAASGVGVGAGIIGQDLDANAIGIGEAVAAVLVSVAHTATAEGVGTAGGEGSITAVVAAAAAGSGAAGAALGWRATLTPAFAGSGAAGATATPRPVITAAGAGSGTATATVVSFLPSGMTKNGTQALTTAYAQVNNWTADTTNYPGSTVSGHGIVAQASKSGATVAASIPYTTSLNCTLTLRLFKNGSQIAQGSATPSAGSGTATVSVTGYSVTSGDIYTVQASASNNFGTIASGANTWVRIT